MRKVVNSQNMTKNKTAHQDKRPSHHKRKFYRQSPTIEVWATPKATCDKDDRQKLKKSCQEEKNKADAKYLMINRGFSSKTKTFWKQTQVFLHKKKLQ